MGREPNFAEQSPTYFGDCAEPLLISLHVPKTAGQTFNRVLTNQYPRRSTLLVGDGSSGPSLQQVAALPDRQKQAIRLVTGHIVFGAHELFPQPSRYISFLREPIARVVSNYWFVRRAETHHLHDIVVSQNMGLMDYVCSDLNPQLRNGQTKLLAGDESGLVDRTTLASAKDHIQEWFLFVGLTERFDESLLLLKDMLGWHRIGYERANTAPTSEKTAPVPDEVVDAIQERNTFDAELYQYCAELFDARVAAAGVEFHERLERFRGRNNAAAVALAGPRKFRRALARSSTLARLRGYPW